MRRWFYRAAGICALGVMLAGCDNVDESIPTIPTPAPIVNESLSGTVTVSGAGTKTFVATAAGTVTATLTAVANQVGEGEEPDTTAVTVGFGLGTWNGSLCQVVLANDNATLGTVVVGNVTAFGTLCIRVYDVGKLTKPISYTVDVGHP
jgi:hypothetical protein